jgi:photosystem II stability/assembly factor-like uncharacterized protein
MHGSRSSSGSPPYRIARTAWPYLVAALWTLGHPPSSQAGWVQLNGPEPPDATVLADHGGLLFQGTGTSDSGDVFRSTDGGSTWSNSRLPNGGALAILSHGPDVYFGAYLSGLHRSTDGGQTWEAVAPEVMGGLSIAALGAAGSTLFAGANDFPGRPIYRSTDDGATWAASPGSPVVEARSMAVLGGVLFVGTFGDGIYRSSDGGDSWAPASDGLPAESQVEALAADGTSLLAGVSKNADGTAFGMYRSEDGGESWTKASLDLPAVVSLRFRALAVAPGKIYAGLSGALGGSGLYLSVDGGAHWEPISAGLPADEAVQAILLLGGDVLVGTPEGAYRTSDDGGAWSYSGQGTAAIRGVQSLLLHDGQLLVGLITGAAQSRGIWRTSDLGQTWSGDPSVPGGTARALLAHDGILYSGIYGGVTRGVYRSTDDGETWEVWNTGMDPSTIVNTLLAQSDVLLAGCYEALYRSTDAGAFWNTVPGMTEVTTLLSDGPVVYAGRSDQGVYRSTDAGVTWTPFNSGLPAGAMNVNDLELVDGTLFAATQLDGVYRFEGGGWVPAGLENAFPGELLSLSGTLVAGTALGDAIYYSVDQGMSWTGFNEDYTGGEVYALAVDGAYLVVGSRGHALWARPLAELPAATSVELSDRTHPDRLLSYPNPFVTSTTLRYQVPIAERVVLQLFDAAGRRITTLVDGPHEPGWHEVRLDGSRLPAGSYFCRARIGSTTEVERLVVAH